MDQEVHQHRFKMPEPNKRWIYNGFNDVSPLMVGGCPKPSVEICGTIVN